MLFYMSDTFEQESERDGKGLENKGLWPNLFNYSTDACISIQHTNCYPIKEQSS